MVNYVHQGNKISLKWTVKKGAGLALEDFSRAVVRLFLINSEDRIYVPCTVDGTGLIEAEIDTESKARWPESAYSAELVWVKNLGPDKSRCLQRSRADNLFFLTSNQNEADSTQAPVVLTIQTVAHSYGYDGMSAYESAVLHGYMGSEADFYNETIAYEIVNEEDGYELFDDNKLRLVKETRDSNTFINGYLGDKQISLKAIPVEYLTLLEEFYETGVSTGHLATDVVATLDDLDSRITSLKEKPISSTSTKNGITVTLAGTVESPTITVGLNSSALWANIVENNELGDVVYYDAIVVDQLTNKYICGDDTDFQIDGIDVGGVVTGGAMWKFVTGGFVAKEPGKGLSNNNYTDAEKLKLAGVANGSTADSYITDQEILSLFDDSDSDS